MPHHSVRDVQCPELAERGGVIHDPESMAGGGVWQETRSGPDSQVSGPLPGSGSAGQEPVLGRPGFTGVGVTGVWVPGVGATGPNDLGAGVEAGTFADGATVGDVVADGVGLGVGYGQIGWSLVAVKVAVLPSSRFQPSGTGPPS